MNYEEKRLSAIAMDAIDTASSLLDVFNRLTEADRLQVLKDVRKSLSIARKALYMIYI